MYTEVVTHRVREWGLYGLGCDHGPEPINWPLTEPKGYVVEYKDPIIYHILRTIDMFSWEEVEMASGMFRLSGIFRLS